MTKTQHFPRLLSPELSQASFEHLKNNIEWQDRIYSRKYSKISRLAHNVRLSDEIDLYILQLIKKVLIDIGEENNFHLLGIYLNYYRDGNDFAPSHSHPGMVQLVISLGATRKFILNRKEYEVKDGDVMIFGSGAHEVPIQEDVTEPRISIATFMQRI